MNCDLDKLTPGVFGVSHGGGVVGDLIRHATGSWAGHAFLYVGEGMLVEGKPPAAALAPADIHHDAIWAHRMWDQLAQQEGWTQTAIEAAQDAVTARGRALIGCSYDYSAYVGFALEVLKLRDEEDLEPAYAHNSYRVCSALVADALGFGGVPVEFQPDDGPGLKTAQGLVDMPPNLVAPGMLLGLMQRLDWS